MNPLRILLVLCLSLFPISSQADEVPDSADVVIYGGTSAAVAAAVQVARMGKSVIIVSPDVHLGGLSSGGLGWTDTGKKETVGGISREFYQRVKAHYDQPEAWRQQKPEDYSRYRENEDAMWVFEPHVAEAIFDAFVAENNIPVLRDAWLDREKGVEVKDGRIVSITTLDGRKFTGKIFMDATYEGDLMAAAGVSYHVGREANSVYGEEWNGNQVGILHHAHFFAEPVDPYKVPGDPSSGLLPRISDEPPGTRGEGDDRVQAYCFRMCLTDDPENRIPFEEPEGYDPEQYELLVRVFETGWENVFHKFDPAPNRKTDTNNHGPFSTDNIGMNYEYPEASYEKRQEIIKEHEVYQKGWLYFIATDPRVPKAIQDEMNRWGLPKDEFEDNGGWSHQLYIREARRMIGAYVMTEHDCMGTKETPASVGMGSYTLDSHNVRRYVTPEGYVQNEGDIGVKPAGAYPISYLSLVPKKEECANLYVPAAMSSSHIAYGSIRMEPVFMILGQSAATGACMAIDGNLDVQDVDYAVLKERLLEDGQVLQYKEEGVLYTTQMDGIVLDNDDAELQGHWRPSSAAKPRVGKEYLHDSKAGDGKASATYSFNVEKAGNYDVQLIYNATGSRASNVPVTITHAEGSKTITVDQRQEPTIEGSYLSLGVFPFAAGEGVGKVAISNKDTDGYVIADGVRLMPVE